MRRLKLGVLALVFCIFIGGAMAVAAEQDDNLCFSTHAGQCKDDHEWQVGWFWANNPPSAESCSAFHDLYGNDSWGMCKGIDFDSSDNDEEQKEAQRLFELTSQWHELPEDESSACPHEGLDPIIDYETGTYTCGTSF